MKFIKVPDALSKAPFNQRTLTLNGLSIVESCMHAVENRGTMYLEAHLLLYVKAGRNVLKDGQDQFVVNKGEMVLLRKTSMVEYYKTGDPESENAYDSMLFFLKDEFLHEFVRMTNIPSMQSEEQVRVLVRPVSERLARFFASVEPYFNEPENIDGGLLKLKILELLYDISAIDKGLLQQIFQMRQPIRGDITAVMENNFTNPVSIAELAYLAGRSLASFKRDFQAIYNMPPSDWIRRRRLEKAKEALENTTMSIADVCYMVGFENTAHFSRIFKEHFGYPPSSGRKQPEPERIIL